MSHVRESPWPGVPRIPSTAEPILKARSGIPDLVAISLARHLPSRSLARFGSQPHRPQRPIQDPRSRPEGSWLVNRSKHHLRYRSLDTRDDRSAVLNHRFRDPS
jgi:hypothetical protein